MLNFNSDHKSINGSLKKSNKKAKIRNIIISGVLVSSIALFGGALLSQVNEVDCNINEVHAHHYVSDKTFDKYMISEKMYSGSWERTEEHIVVDEQMKELIDFENEEGLFRISQNEDKINEITSSQEDYVEYRYQYLWQQQIPSYTIGANGTMQLHYNYIPHQKHSWTADVNHQELTGEERTIHHVYYGYKVVRGEDGQLKAIQSKAVDNLEDLSEEYAYIKSDFYKKIDLNTGKEADYEDGPEYEAKLEKESSKTR